MKLERSNVEFPLWRKKVDASLFEHNGTTIHAWACTMWGIQKQIGDCISKNTDEATVTIQFEGADFLGCVTVAKEGRKTPAYRLWYEDDLAMELKHKFLMPHMRSLEKRLRPEAKEDVEKDIPFWEFLDIELNSSKKVFRLEAFLTIGANLPGAIQTAHRVPLAEASRR